MRLNGSIGDLLSKNGHCRHQCARNMEVSCGIQLVNPAAARTKTPDGIQYRGIGTEPVDLSFQDVSLSVYTGFQKEKKKILNNISGTFPAGELVAVIGPSGAGKTILLESLRGFHDANLDGTILTNGTPRDVRLFKRMSCYISLDNHLQSLLTVWENMKFAADLKLEPRISEDKKDVIINDILNSLFLDDCLHTPASCLSGGQKKRLSVALELIHNPAVMLLDEPTTGLDSYSSMQCIRLLRDLARKGKTIVCTIQQPSASHTMLFDQLYILASGRCVYQGSPKNLVRFLEYADYPCPKYYSPIDLIVELASSNSGTNIIYKMVELNRNGKSEQWLKERSLGWTKSKVVTCSDTFKSHQVDLSRQFAILVSRCMLKARRDVTLTYLRLAVNVLLGVIFGSLYWQIGADGEKVRSNYSFLYSVLVHHMMSTMMLTLLSTSKEISVLSKEYFNGWYSLKVFYTASTLADIPISIICCLTFTIIVYPTTDQPMELDRVALFTIISVLVVLVSQSYGLFIGSLCAVTNGTFLGLLLSVPIMMLSSWTGESEFINWLRYGSYMSYGFDGILGVTFGRNRTILYCPEDKYCHYKYPRKFLREVYRQPNSVWVDVLGLCASYLILRFAAYLAIRWRISSGVK